VPNDILWDLTSMGTLVAFTVVSAGVIILRRTRPDMKRGFRVPFYPVLPILSIIACLYLISSLQIATFVIFGVWVALGGIFYLLYGMHHSHLERDGEASK
jgi:APA family basic amino acid/polyamine antiporter